MYLGIRLLITQGLVEPMDQQQEQESGQVLNTMIYINQVLHQVLIKPEMLLMKRVDGIEITRTSFTRIALGLVAGAIRATRRMRAYST